MTTYTIHLRLQPMFGEAYHRRVYADWLLREARYKRSHHGGQSNPANWKRLERSRRRRRS